MSISTNNLAVTVNFYIPAKYVGWALPTKTRIWWADVGCKSKDKDLLRALLPRGDASRTRLRGSKIFMNRVRR